MTNEVQLGTAAAGAKLAKLRARTDSDLAVLLRRMLEQGFQSDLRGAHEEAENLHAGAAVLIPVLKSLPVRDAEFLRALFDQLRVQLDKSCCGSERLAC